MRSVRMRGLYVATLTAKKAKAATVIVTLRSRPHTFERRARKARKGFHAAIGSTYGCHRVTESQRTDRGRARQTNGSAVGLRSRPTCAAGSNESTNAGRPHRGRGFLPVR